jgi:SAM-dependent methyltransferase
MRIVTRQVAFEPGGWTPERRAKVGALFDDLASEWHTRYHPGRDAPLLDALDRGVAAAPSAARPRRVALEIGSGTGGSSASIAERFPTVLAIDLSWEMLQRAPAAPAHRVWADASVLPLAPGTADVMVLVNTLLFPAEVDRVLHADGLVVWVNTSGDQTPIYLAADDVLAALPGGWSGVTAAAGGGTWAVAWRTSH